MTYRQMMRALEKQRVRISARQRRQIAQIYREAARHYGIKITRASDELTRELLLKYAEELKGESKGMFRRISETIKTGMKDTASAVTTTQAKFWGSLAKGFYDKVADTLSPVPQAVVNEIASGDLYKDGKGLSSRIWRMRKAYEHDIDYIIQRGIVEKKSVIDLARDLETFVNPDARVPFELRKVYPQATGSVDYNAQRLARTACTHAYQKSFERTNKDNPFVQSYTWHSGNGGRVCPLCKKRDGQHFKKGHVPLDHPNGMCIITADIPMDLTSIGSEIADWMNGKPNAGLDKWVGKP